MNIYADLRWNWRNGAAGIGVVKDEMLSRKPPHLKIVELQARGSLGSPFGPIALSAALRARGKSAGVFWSPGFMPPATMALPTVVTVHDLLHLKYYSRLHRDYYNLVLKRLYRRCSAIVCVSECVRQEFIEWSHLPADRVHLIYNGVSDRFAQSKAPSPYPFPYVLYAGNRRPYKNLDRLLEAYAASALPKRKIHFIMTGDEDRSILALINRLGITSLVQFSGRVNDAELDGLYKGARVVTLVSLSEGFGLPILEAMASGVPVLTSNVSSMSEIAASAAVQVDPWSVDDIRGGLDLLALDEGERERRIELGKLRAKMFSWDAAASKLWQLVGALSS